MDSTIVYVCSAIRFPANIATRETLKVTIHVVAKGCETSTQSTVCVELSVMEFHSIVKVTDPHRSGW